jgi:hypothetical protein
MIAEDDGRSIINENIDPAKTQIAEKIIEIKNT